MRVLIRSKLGDDVLGGSIVEWFAIRRCGAFRQRLKCRAKRLFATIAKGFEGVFKERRGSGVRNESGHGPDDVRARAELRPVKAESAQIGFVAFERTA